MLNLNYNLLEFSDVKDIIDFYKSNSLLKETGKIKSMIAACKILFKLPSDRIKLEVSQEDRVYKIYLISPDVKKNVLGYFVYIPLENRVDLYTDDLTTPTMQWQTKKLVFSTLPGILTRAEIERALDKVINCS